MFNTLRQKLGQYSRAALAAVMQGSGAAALYICSSTLLAGILLTVIMTYTWNIDRERWFRALAVLQGIELAEMQRAERDAAAEISFEEVMARRAERLREEEFRQEITQRAGQWQLPPEEPRPQPPPPPSDADRISAYEQRVQADIARSRSAGLAEQTRLLATMLPDDAKEVIRRLWREGQNQRVMQMIMDMEDRPRERILFAMRVSDDAELQDLCEILQRIGDGEPTTSIIQNAAREP